MLNSSIDVTASDSIDKIAVVGNLQVGSSVAVGDSLAYNDVGTSSNRQKTTAAITNSTLNTVKTSEPSIKVSAVDSSALKTIGAGVELTGGSAAVQGALSVVATINKDVTATFKDSNVETANLNGDAKTSEDIQTLAGVLSAGSNAAIGAGIAVNDHTNTMGVTFGRQG